MEQSLIFGGINSSDYGIYISGEGVFNAPKRDVETISIPGRNGVFLLDHNRFDNIVVTYPAHCKTDNLEEFRALLRDYRNALLSLSGYQRLTDTLNGDEYRMGAFIDSFDAEPIGYSTAATFDLKFNCKPQRFLKIGDLPISVASGDVITNPTLFDAHPIIKFNAGGNGTINIGDDVITVLNAEVGNVDLSLSRASVSKTEDSIRINNRTVYQAGDPITFKASTMSYIYRFSGAYVDDVTSSNEDGIVPSLNKVVKQAIIELTPTDTVFTAGTPATVTKSIDVTIKGATPSTTDEQTRTFTVTIAYNGTNTITVSWNTPSFGANYSLASHSLGRTYSATADSSKPTVSGDIYIDLDIGEAYGIDDGSVVSLNNFINLGGELPVLPPGSTTITYSNTISNVEITPRYWRV